MEMRRSTWEATIRLAIALSTIAAVAAMTVSAVGDVSEAVIVLSVIVIGFVTSWVRTGHPAPREITTHRVARVPVRRAAIRF
jgi:hypothetical protein